MEYGINDERILDVDDDGRCGIHRRQFFNSENCLEESPSRAAVVFRNLDAHQAEVEELPEEIRAKRGLFVHLADMGGDLLAREAAHGVAQEALIFGKLSERGGRAGRFHGVRV